MKIPRRTVRRVRVHLDGNRPSVEGLYLGTSDGHYVLGRPEVLEAAGRTIALESERIWVPKAVVVFIEVWEGGRS